MTEAIWDAERSLWLGGRLAYATHMAQDCLMAFPQAGVLDSHQVLDKVMAVPRWRGVEMTDQVIAGGADTLVLGYCVTAQRERERYRALCTSTWRRDGTVWKLIQHQQSPF